ncbi:hypothetical protein GCM10009838_09060 [Catenulispora subtropica]|uniref:Uncharacterized protein n=1 Tax=Catenulispora subtropica TaxID=450798 RepID=A0ABP5BZX4_9ACTN
MQWISDFTKTTPSIHRTAVPTSRHPVADPSPIPANPPPPETTLPPHPVSARFAPTPSEYSLADPASSPPLTPRDRALTLGILGVSRLRALALHPSHLRGPCFRSYSP